VCRSTAYQHFPTRERLVEATETSVTDNLCEAVFGASESDPTRELTVEGVTEHIARFAMENPELGCVWLTQLLTLQTPASDRFFRMYVSHLEAFAKTEYAQPGIDAEVHAVMMLSATLLWPVWTRSHTLDPKERQHMSQRFSQEMLRLGLHGVLQRRFRTGRSTIDNEV
jgi:AcrR family transcriptional regulator